MGLAYGKITPPAEYNHNLESNQQVIQEEHSSARPFSDEDQPAAQSGTSTCTGPCNVASSGGGPSATESSSSGGCGATQQARKCKRARKMPRRPDEKRPRVTTGNASDDPLEQQTVLQPSASVYFDALDVLEQEECSEQVLRENDAAAGAPELFHCSICMEWKPIGESFDVRPCLHIYCTGCASRYVASKVEQNATSIRCPEPGCRDGMLETEACRPILDEAVYQRWLASLCESAVGAEGVYCPYRDCSALLIDDGESGGGVNVRVECPHCWRAFCAGCNVPWHEGMECSEFQALPEGERSREDLMLRELAANRRWQRCPRCKIFVERTEGCVFITCRCGYCFCYGCGSPLSGESHFCQKCRRTW